MTSSFATDFCQLYKLTESITQKGMEIIPTQETFDRFSNNQMFNLFRGDIKIEEPVQTTLYKNGKALDFHGYIAERLVSQKFLSNLKQNSFTGWSTYPAKLFDKKGNEIEGYTGLSVVGKCGPQLKEERERVTKYDPRIPNIYKAWKGFYFDPKTWDGSDIFSPEDTAVIIVTEKVKKALEEAEVTNVEFTPLTEVESLS